MTVHTTHVHGTEQA